MKSELFEPNMNSLCAQPRPAPRNGLVASGRPMPPPDIVSTDALFKGHQEILISHNGEHYRLRITKNAKLILTK